MEQERTPVEIIGAIRRDLAAGYDGIGADQVRVLLDAYDAARADVRRLEWLEAQIATDVGVNLYQRIPRGVGLFCMASEKSADTLREAIDAASSPEEATERQTNG